MSGVIGKNEDRYSGQITAVVGIGIRSSDPLLNTIGAWVSAGSMNKAQAGQGSFGASGSSALTVSGSAGGAQAEIYDGTSWSITGALSEYKETMYGLGIVSAGLVCCGSDGNTALDATEEFNGSTWSAGGDVPIARNYGHCGAGTLSASMICGGTVAPGNTISNVTYEYNGSSWSAGGNLSTGRFGQGIAGTQTAGLAAGGNDNGSINNNNQITSSEEYNGTSWSAGGSLTNRQDFAFCSGTQTSAFSGGGKQNSPITVFSSNERYDGTSWRIDQSLLGTVYNGGQSGSAAISNTCIFGGSYSIARLPATQEFVAVDAEVTEGTVWYNTVDRQLKVASPGSGAGGAWSTGGNLGTAVGGCGGVGGPSSAMNVAGDIGSPVSAVSNLATTYDGSAWSAISNQITSRTMPGSAGTVAAVLIYGGRTSTSESSYVSNVELYDGLVWAAMDPLNDARGNFASFGTQNACMRAGGGGSGSPVYKDDAELYDGASWANTTVPDIRYKSGGAGTLSSGYMIHGSNSSGVASSVRLWNGVAWSDGPGFSGGKTNENVGIGTTSATMAVGGATGLDQVNHYNDIAWSAGPEMSQGRQRSSGGGTASYGLVAGGRNSSNAALTSTEEWNTNMTGIVIKQGLSNFTLRSPT